MLFLFGGESFSWGVVFNGTTTVINAGSEASIDNLADGAVTLEMVLSPTAGSLGRLFSKYGGIVADYYAGGAGVEMTIYCATTNAHSSALCTQDGLPHHYAFEFDDAGDRKIKIFIDGAEVSYLAQTAGVGAIVADADYDMSFGNYAAGGDPFTGKIHWVRISNVIRYTATFTPPTSKLPPAVDANTVRLFKMDEGKGTVIYDKSSNAQNATLTAGTWVKE